MSRLTPENVCNRFFPGPLPTIVTSRLNPMALIRKDILGLDAALFFAYSDEAGQRFHAKLDTYSRASWTVGA